MSHLASDSGLPSNDKEMGEEEAKARWNRLAMLESKADADGDSRKEDAYEAPAYNDNKPDKNPSAWWKMNP